MCNIFQGNLKKHTVEKIEEYVHKDERLPILLRRMRDSGVKVFLLTNSDYWYTNQVMEYLLSFPDEVSNTPWVYSGIPNFLHFNTLILFCSKENQLSCVFMKKENEFSCLFGHNIISNGLYQAIRSNIGQKDN